jgi:hypothetical protein
MQGLEPGDVIEYEYITLKPPALVKKDAYITAQVYLFQDIEKPFHHTQWYMEYPASMPMRFYEQNLPAPAGRGESGGMKWRNWEYRDMPRIAPEPDTPNKLLYVPMVEAVGGVTWKDLGLYLKEGVTGAFQITPEIEARYEEAVAGAKSQGEKLQSIVNYLLKEVDGEHPTGWQDPTQTLLTRQGSRLPPACAFLKLAHIPFKVLVAEVVPDKVYREDLPRLGQFSMPVLEVDMAGSTPRYLTLDSPYRDPDVLPWYLQGASALPITGAEPWKEVLIPADLRPWSDAQETENRELHENGDLKLHHTQILDPESAESLRSSFHKIDKDQLKRAIQMALSRQYGNADLIDYHAENLEDIRQPLTWSFDLLIHGYATRDGDKLTVSDPLPSLRLGQSLASLGERNLPLTTGGPIFVNQKFTIRVPEGATLDYTLPEVDRSNRFASYSLKSTYSEGEVAIERKVSLPFEVVWPKDYKEFAAFLRGVDDAESGQLTVKLKKGGEKE